jgi:hypothetical protein
MNGVNTNGRPRIGGGVSRRFLLALLPATVVTSGSGCKGEDAPFSQRPSDSAAQISVTRPTVISWFVVPPGAVDTLSDLAVEADDWSFSMAALRDSLEASGIGLAMVLDSLVRVRVEGGRDTTVALGGFRSSGYLFARPNGPFCAHPGGTRADSVVATARAYARGTPCT